MDKFDVAVVGGGPGGYVSAIRCAQYGLRVVLFEKQELGGTCLNRGCIPTKTLLHSAELYASMKNAARFGIHASDVSFRYEEVAERKAQVSARLRSGVQGLLRKNKVTVVNAEARFLSRHQIEADGKCWEAEQIIIASGSVPVSIPISGAELEGVINSNDFLALRELPESAVIIGGGVIGIELATVLNSFGKKVTILEMLPTILGAGIDREINDCMIAELSRRGVEIRTSARVSSIEPGFTVSYDCSGKTGSANAECVIMAVGRKAFTAGLGLEKLGLQTEKGVIAVDNRMRTSVPGVYAIGDVTGKNPLAHVASAQGRVAAANAAGKECVMHYEAVPSCVYSDPEFACVGLTAGQAEKAGHKVKVGKFSVAGNGKCLVLGESTGFAKLVTDADTGEILGAQLLAPRATDMIFGIAELMNAEGTLAELSETVCPHPSVSEIIMEAAQDADGMSCHK